MTQAVGILPTSIKIKRMPRTRALYIFCKWLHQMTVTSFCSQIRFGSAPLIWGTVVFHGKCLPWFVSDTTITDFTQTLTSCQQPYSPASPGSPQSTQGQQPSEAWGA
eukprot:scaffold30816_cov18-Tisochrysis_lutea.AAC.1